MKKVKVSGYMCVLGGIIGTFVNAGVYRSNSLIYQIMLEKFGASNTLTAWIFATNELCGWSSAWITALLCARFGCRKTVILGGIIKFLGLLLCAFPPSILYMYFTYGLLCAVGETLSWDSIYIILTHHYQKQKARAIGIATSGGSLGAIVMAPLIQYLYEKYAYNGTMLILAGITLHLCVSGALCSPLRRKAGLDTLELEFSNADSNSNKAISNDENISGKIIGPNNKNENGQGEVNKPEKNTRRVKRFKQSVQTICSFWKKKLFMGFIINIGCLLFGYSASVTFMAGLSDHKHISKMQSALILSVSGGIDIFTRPLAGVIYDLKIFRVRRELVFCLICLMHGFCVAMLPLTYNFTTFLINWSFFTVFTTSSVSQYYTVMGDLVTKEELPHAMGFTGLCLGVASTIGPVIGGVIRDVTGQYDLVYYSSGAVVFSGSLIFLVIYACSKSPGNNNNCEKLAKVESMNEE